ncbi:MAG: glycosyltransferase family 4 protein [Flavobacteriales bacterium]
MTKQPQLAFYCSSTSWGGLEMNTVRYAQWMQERGWSVALYCVNGSQLQHAAVASGLNTFSVRRNGKYLDIVNAWRVSRLFKQQQVSLCWFRDTRDFSLLGWVKFFRGGSLNMLYQQAMQFGISKKDLIHTIRFRQVDAWVSTLHFLAQQVRDQTHYPHARIHVVPLGVDDERLFAKPVTRQEAREFFGLSDEAFVAGIIGRLDRLKGQHVAIEAIRLLHDEGIAVHLLIVGESTRNEGNYYEQEIKLLTQELELTEFVHFAAYTKKVELFYEAIDVFALCSKGETFGTVTIEAMAFGKPIVGTGSSGTPEILSGDCGLLFEPESAEGLAVQIKCIMNDEVLHSTLTKNSRAKFELQFSKQASLDGMEKVVNHLLSAANKKRD